MKKLTLLIVAGQLCHTVNAQEGPASDSTKTLDPVVITAFEQNRVTNSGSIVKLIDPEKTNAYNKASLVSSVNTIAGIRMEERSPGSYRLNIRGSSMRSPFGVRNIKLYWNDIPITDAGGNTYLNQFAVNNAAAIEVFKGPAGSMYGAGTGGLLLMRSFANEWKPSLRAEYITGSFGLSNLLTSVAFGNGSNRNLVTYNHISSDGYRAHTNVKRDNLSFVSQIRISEKQQLTASILYSDLYYQTPGGLTLAEFNKDPKQFRPAAGGFPSAVTAKAAIFQKNILVGVSHRFALSSTFRNTTAVYGNFAQIHNPTFRNYERRVEPGFGGRTSFIYEKKLNGMDLQLIAGTELQRGIFNTQVSRNRNGNPDSIFTNDDIEYFTGNIFTQADLNFSNTWIITAGASINRSKVDFERLSSIPVMHHGRTYKNELSPRLAVQRIFKPVTVFASASKGFSPPTISELLPSTGVISTFLEAEEGTNYEAGVNISLLKGKLKVDVTGYYFNLNNALVSRKDSSNADYFVNAGNAKQKGIELNGMYSTGTLKNKFIKGIQIRSAYSLSRYKYGNFIKGAAVLSGRLVPGVPSQTWSFVADLDLASGFYLGLNYYAATRMFLDDANTVTVPPYKLFGAKAGWKKNIGSRIGLNLYLGGENLFDENYSLGNDINAAGGRYYNAAPGRNFYAGIGIQYNKK